MTNEIARAILGCEPNCLTCKRTMIPGEIFANGYSDGRTICHACKKERNGRMDAELKAAPGSQHDFDEESTERRYGRSDAQ